MTIAIKICGLTHIDAVNAAVKNKANYIGCVFYKYSPRNITPQLAQHITQNVPNKIKKVALISAYDSNIVEIFKYYKPDIWQFHADDDPKDILAIKDKYKLPVIKTIRVTTLEDLAIIEKYNHLADMFLFESMADNKLYIDKPGVKFDWSILKKLNIDKPWILSGSLDKYNVNYAIRVSGASMVNASVTIESTPGIKDPNMIKDFINVVRSPNY